MADSSNLKKIPDAKRRYKPGVIPYTTMGYWEPDYQVKDTDILAMYCAMRPGSCRRSGPAALPIHTSIYASAPSIRRGDGKLCGCRFSCSVRPLSRGSVSNEWKRQAAPYAMPCALTASISPPADAIERQQRQLRHRVRDDERFWIGNSDRLRQQGDRPKGAAGRVASLREDLPKSLGGQLVGNT
jgi:hypothetical protein